MSFKPSNATSKNLLKNKTQQPKEIAGRAVHECIQLWRGWGRSFTGRWGNPRPHFKFQVHPAYRLSLFSTPPTKSRCQQKWVQHPWEATVGRSTYTETLHTHGCDSWHVILETGRHAKGSFRTETLGRGADVYAVFRASGTQQGKQ